MCKTLTYYLGLIQPIKSSLFSRPKLSMYLSISKRNRSQTAVDDEVEEEAQDTTVINESSNKASDKMDTTDKVEEES